MSLITISHDLGSRGLEIAKLVAEKLDLELYDDDRLKEKALEFGVSPKNLPGIEEKAPGFFERLRQKTPEVFLDILQNVVLKVAEEGNGVILGHGSQVLLGNFDCALHVRVFASFETRIKNEMMFQNLDFEKAKTIIKANDSKLNSFYKYAFHLDTGDPSLYDITINTDKLSVEQAAKTIIELYHSDEMQACSIGAIDAMRRMATIKKIHAILLQADVSVDLISIEIPKMGVVELTGFAEDEDQKVHLIKTVEAMEEISTVEESLLLRSDVPEYL